MSLILDFELPREQFTLTANLNLQPEGVHALFGRSGCGKTSLLRAIAGLEPDCRGQISFNGDHWLAGKNSRPTEQRRLAMVFQQPGLLPHLGVRDNLLFGYKRTPPAQRHMAPDEVIKMLDLSPLLRLRTRQLSGGQAQRVALGRALLRSPQLLLLDEPLAALDHIGKAEILPYLQRMISHSRIPVIFVSHHLDEVVQFADQLILMEQGQIVSAGPLQAQLSRPEFARFGALSVLACRICHEEGAMLELALGQQRLRVPALPLNGTECRLRVQARDVSLSLNRLQDSSISNQLESRIEAISPAPHEAEVLIRLNVEGQPLQALVTRNSQQRLQLEEGMQVFAQIKAVAIH